MPHLLLGPVLLGPGWPGWRSGWLGRACGDSSPPAADRHGDWRRRQRDRRVGCRAWNRRFGVMNPLIVNRRFHLREPRALTLRGSAHGDGLRALLAPTV